MARKQKEEFETVSMLKGDFPQGPELVPLEDIGIPKMDDDPDLSCFLYRGRETKEVLSGSIAIVNHSEIDYIFGELYVFKYFPNPETFFYILRTLELPHTLGGFDLRTTGEKEIIHVPTWDLLHKMYVGRVWYTYVDRRLYLDRLKDQLGAEPRGLYFQVEQNG